MALKVDITKAFDTLSWKFLLRVLKSFGFGNVLCSWIHSILVSAQLSININGSQHGFFNCTRGVRQGDLLSPLLFCLAQDVLSRGLSNLVNQDSLSLIKASDIYSIPSYIMYADDILLLCKGNIRNINLLKEVFLSYFMASGQLVNPNKSFVYAGAIPSNVLQSILDLTGFSQASFPFTYHGVPLFKGRVKEAFLQPVADKIVSKLAAWKGSVLSIAGRTTLVKSVVYGMLSHIMSIYSWPIALLKYLEKCIRNFIWIGSVENRKLLQVAWKKICKPYSNGGLGLRSLVKLNEACNLKLAWDMIVDINFWLDSWCGQPLIDKFSRDFLRSNDIDTSSKVADFFLNGQWRFPAGWGLIIPLLILRNFPILSPTEVDILHCPHTASGEISLKDAYCYKDPSTPISLTKSVWSRDVPPAESMVVWKLMLDNIPSDDKLKLIGLRFASMCSLCNNYEETSNHLFFECSFACHVWTWFYKSIKISNLSSTLEDWRSRCSSWSKQCAVVLKAAIIYIIYFVWEAKNWVRFKNIHPNLRVTIQEIRSQTHLTGLSTSVASSSSMEYFCILKQFNIKIRPPDASRIIEFFWHPPPIRWVKCNTDGAYLPNSMAAGCCGLFRDHLVNFLLTFAKFVPWPSSTITEFVTPVDPLSHAGQKRVNL
ncbi:uncharacterized protein LOC131597717 [Vicia villosa]|uniref:uncharacterized protein LOC131597717 n=1 Tax=Vicia villosa TaxID=3911 RepID=UPI00273B5EBB|nr:uncharacterized protein LOC131597717 [Vicia villosa]